MDYIVEGRYTYKVQKKVEADSEDQAIAIAVDEPLCEWDSIEQDSYFEDVSSVTLMTHKNIAEQLNLF